MKDSDFTRLNMQRLSKPPEKGGIYRIIKNSYWLLDINGYGLLYKGYSRQCNSIKGIGNNLIISENHPAVMEQFFETIFLPEEEK